MIAANRFIPNFVILFFSLTFCMQVLATENFYINNPAVDTIVKTTAMAVDITITSSNGDYEISCGLKDVSEEVGEYTQKIVYCSPTVDDSGFKPGDLVNISSPFHGDFILCIADECEDNPDNSKSVKGKKNITFW
ncbi:hypothetical protein BHECKSOX_1485 [Bathymodiolus heckerae thiotrophic gill symbiont]|uniref:hypothetical protein n=1 Tax=Bathymodiolus heckerae thiotrophic gill symbiont TaxID=1052212 RepID=UPI0010BB8998|nr:hypothetical protein [Bathymodiolus heckerae thiotrophic gill symbiont]SHN92808.1 hypothetical protein BHECKSOX_1485 [Bathymodiolus heckerae thiotrophic gill symbiont]